MRLYRFLLSLFVLPLLALGAPHSVLAATHHQYARHKHVSHKTAYHSRHIVYARISRVAPADEYFGRLKMSILGIRNELRDLDQRLSFSPERGNDVLGSASFVEDAIRDWQSKYPADPWLPKSVYQLTHLYARVHTPEGHAKAVSALNWLVSRYHGSPFCTVAQAEVGAVLK